MFLHCKIAKRVWFANPWGTRWERVDGRDLVYFPNCIADPMGILPVHREDKDDFFAYCVIAMEHLWWIRNQVLHEGQVEDIVRAPESVMKHFKELKEALRRDRMDGNHLENFNARVNT